MMLSDINNDHTSPYDPYEPSQQAYWSPEQLGAQPSAPLRNYGQVPPPPSSGRRPTKKSGGGPRAGAIFALAVVLLLVFGTGLFAGWQFARSSASSAATATGSATGGLQAGTNAQTTVPALTGNNSEAVREAAIAKVKPAVVEVNTTTGLGSGVIVDKRGYIVTNNHVVQNARTIQVVLSDGTKLTAQLTGTDTADDLAVLKINPPAHMVVATLGDSSKLSVGQSVLAIGNPLGITQTVTEGIISALGRTVSEPATQTNGGATIPNAIQTDAPINPGNSGGALIDLQGNLIGIPTLTAIDPEFNAPASGVGFAIPSNRVNLIVPQIINNGKVTHTGRAALGVEVAPVDATMAQQDNLSVDHGLLIAQVVNGGPAAQAGLQSGDVIVQVNNQDVTDTSSLGDVLANKNPGDKVSVKIFRGNQQLTLTVTLGELQAQS
jgi:S1-C subfamily serine protease